ncbi:50S ribosomal protein L6 [Henriciella aquimarina]|uniref:50S ribosomal protein L6 n=1 Tax=Henriciella aquimarina TaxID=545261 RepID=UPI0009FEAF74|nr:50S ribosomal protein L6 [Henriciella aquimarina]
MSRIGKLPIQVPNGTTVTVDGGRIQAKGPKGELGVTVSELMTVTLEEGELSIMPRKDYVDEANERIKANEAKGKKKMTFAEALDPRVRTQWGTARANASNVVEGASTGFSRSLELVGVGYRAQMQGTDLKLSLGYSHDVIFKAPQGIKIETPKPTEITVSGADKQAVGQAAAEIRQFRKPEPFKGKGVRYAGEYVRRKEGKKK